MTRRKVSVLASVRAELKVIGKVDCPAGAVALTLAARLDGGEDPGSAMAAMAKELRTTMTELTRSAPAVADPIDDLKQRRSQRIAGGGTR